MPVLIGHVCIYYGPKIKAPIAHGLLIYGQGYIPGQFMVKAIYLAFRLAALMSSVEP